MLAHFESKKFFAAAATQVLTAALLWFDKLSGAEYVSVTLACIGCYTVAQAFVDVKTK